MSYFPSMSHLKCQSKPPLFGSVTIVEAMDEQLAQWWASRFGLPRPDVYAAGVFDSLTGAGLPDAFVDALLATSQAKGLQTLIAGGGHLTGPSEEYFTFKKAQCAGRALFEKLGGLTADEVSLFLSSLGLGIASSPWLCVGTIGSAAAMREHGLADQR